jgi:hypothetical protein
VLWAWSRTPFHLDLVRGPAPPPSRAPKDAKGKQRSGGGKTPRKEHTEPPRARSTRRSGTQARQLSTYAIDPRLPAYVKLVFHLQSHSLSLPRSLHGNLTPGLLCHRRWATMRQLLAVAVLLLGLLGIGNAWFFLRPRTSPPGRLVPGSRGSEVVPEVLLGAKKRRGGDDVKGKKVAGPKGDLPLPDPLVSLEPEELRAEPVLEEAPEAGPGPTAGAVEVKPEAPRGFGKKGSSGAKGADVISLGDESSPSPPVEFEEDADEDELTPDFLKKQMALREFDTLFNREWPGSLL